MAPSPKTAKTSKAPTPTGNRLAVHPREVIKNPSGLSVDDILAKAYVEPDIVNSTWVTITRLENVAANTKRGKILQSTTLTAVPGDRETRQHKQTIEAKEPGYNGPFRGRRGIQNKDRPRVILSCDCARFLFNWEWALNRKGAARIIYSNGEPPNAKNPNYHAAPCKHLYKVLHLIRARNL